MIGSGRAIIRAGYAAGTSVTDIARQCESTPGSVKVIAHKMGLRHRCFISVRIPIEHQADYLNMTDRKKIPAVVARRMLGLEEAGL